MNVLLALLALIVTAAFACEMTLPHQMVILSADANGSHIIRASNCQEAELSEMIKTISELEGRVSTVQLKSMMESKGHLISSIEPHMIQIQQLKSIIREQLPLPQGIQVKSTSGINTAGVIALAPGDRVEVRCPQCLYGPQQAVNVAIQGFDGTSREYLAAADFKKMVRAYRVLMPLTSFATVSASEVKEEYTEAVPQTDLVTDTDALKFYKTNKPIRTGDLLRYSDLNAVNLVKAGLKTDVILENSMVRIKTQGISRGNGTIGDVVEVWHPQKNRKYQGKVIDTNKVLVEL